MKLLLFDIDGTLLLTGGSGDRASELAFEEVLNIKNAWKGIKPHGKTDPVIFNEIANNTLGRDLTQNELESIIDSYESHFELAIRDTPRFRLMPGITKLCEKLSNKEDVLLGIQTGNLETTGRMKLERGNINHHFPFGGFACDSHIRPELVKIAIEKGKALSPRDIESIFVIGDTPADVMAGKAAGATTIAVATAVFSKEELEVAEPDFLFNDFSDTDYFLEIISHPKP